MKIFPIYYNMEVTKRLCNLSLTSYCNYLPHYDPWPPLRLPDFPSLIGLFLPRPLSVFQSQPKNEYRIGKRSVLTPLATASPLSLPRNPLFPPNTLPTFNQLYSVESCGLLFSPFYSNRRGSIGFLFYSASLIHPSLHNCATIIYYKQWISLFKIIFWGLN